MIPHDQWTQHDIAPPKMGGTFSKMGVMHLRISRALSDNEVQGSTILNYTNND